MGDAQCEGEDKSNCHVEAQYSLDHGRKWSPIESYVRQCAWARDSELKIDERLVLCESYRDKKGRQALFGYTVPMELVVGGNFFEKSSRVRLFEQIVGYATFSEYLLVAEVCLDVLFLAPMVDLVFVVVLFADLFNL